MKLKRFWKQPCTCWKWFSAEYITLREKIAVSFHYYIYCKQKSDVGQFPLLHIHICTIHLDAYLQYSDIWPGHNDPMSVLSTPHHPLSLILKATSLFELTIAQRNNACLFVLPFTLSAIHFNGHRFANSSAYSKSRLFVTYSIMKQERTQDKSFSEYFIFD